MHCNILNLLGLNFDFCDFCAFLRLYQCWTFDVHLCPRTLNLGTYERLRLLNFQAIFRK